MTATLEVKVAYFASYKAPTIIGTVRAGEACSLLHLQLRMVGEKPSRWESNMTRRQRIRDRLLNRRPK